MLDKYEELRVENIAGMVINAERENKLSIDLPLATVVWLTNKLHQLNEELKKGKIRMNNFEWDPGQELLNCTGQERHSHYEIDTGLLVTHEHEHTKNEKEFNRLHHHAPVEHANFTDEFLESTAERTKVPF